MRRILVGGALTLLAGVLYACGDGQVWGDDRVDEDGIQACFQEYRAGIGSSAGATVAALVSTRTHDLFESLRDIATMGDRQTIAGLPIYNKIQALALRASFSAKELDAMSGEEVFAAVVDRGWIDASMLAQVELTEIEGDTVSAVARVIEGGEVTDQGISFVREEERWRVDLFEALGDSDRFEKTDMIRAGMMEDAFVLMRVEEYTGAAAPNGIWTPPLAIK